MKATLPLAVLIVSLNAALHAGDFMAQYPLDTITAGTTPDASGGGNNATLQNGPVAVAGLIGSGALQFDGTDDYLSTTTQYTNPAVFTLAMWFKTNTTAGGKLIGFGNAQLDISGSYDRHIYMANDGRILFGCYPGAVRTIATTGTYNDNQWHHVAASLSAAGMKLYLDGVLIATDAATTTAEGYTGYWKIGRDNLGGWTDTPASQAFNGTLDEIRIYNIALTDAQVADLAKRTATVALSASPSPSFTGETVVFSGTVTSNLSTPTGTVELFEGAMSLGTSPVTAGNYSIAVSTLTAGLHVLKATYSGNATLLGSDSPNLNHTVVDPEPTVTVLTATPTASTVFGAPLTLTASVTANTGTPAGTVTFMIDGNPTVVPLANGLATLTTSALALGAHTFAANYTAGRGFVDSTSGNVNYTITQAASTTALVSSLNPIAAGAPVTFTATVAGVAPSTASAGGNVVFTVGGQPQAPVALVNGVAALTLTLAAGDTTVSAAYGGSAEFTGSTSAPLVQRVIAPPIANAQTVFVPINGSKALTLTGSDPANGLALTYTVLTPPASGALTGSAPSLVFTPANGFTGQVTFTFSVNNTLVDSLPATVTLIVLPPPSFGSSVTLAPNPLFAGQTVSGFSPAQGVTTSWDWGDGTPPGSGPSASHTYTQTGVYTVTVTVTDPLTGLSTAQSALVYVSAGLDGSVGGTGGGATPPGTLGILVGGSGASSAQGGNGKISCNYVRRDKTYYSGQLGSLSIPAALTQAALAEVPSTITIGTGANASVFRFDLNAKGKGKATGLPKVEFSVKKKRFSFKAQREDLTALTETLGGPREFVKSTTPVILMVPVTLQLGTQYFVAMTFQLNYQQINNGGKGTLAK